MLNKELEYTLNIAYKIAKDRRHEYMTVEHLLLALLDNSAASKVVTACGGSIKRLHDKLSKFIDETTPIIPDNSTNRETQPTLGFQRVLQRAVFQVQSSGKSEVTGGNVLAAIFSEQESQSVYFLRQENISRMDVINYITHGIGKEKEDENGGRDVGGGMSTPQSLGGTFGQPMSPFNSGMSEEELEQEEESKPPLERFCINLNEKALEGSIDPLIGREKEIDRTIQVLCRRRKNNPLLVGEAGVGKTAIAEGLAKLIIDKRVPDVLKDGVVYALDLGALLAGTKYRGDFEKRLKNVLRHLKSQPAAILFIDEIHTIIGAGAASGGVMDVSNLIKPLLASSDLTCIGSTTYAEYRGIFEKDHALARRFQKIDITEPTVDETISILKGLKSRFEDHHGVKYTNKALEAAAELSQKYITDRCLPDKAIDVVDEVGAYQNLLPASKRKKTITEADIEVIVAMMARIPEKKVSTSDKELLKNLGRDLKMLVFGQDQAIESLDSAIKLARSGLRDPSKPIGSFLFAGPTGVGKTEVTKQLAELLGINLIRFDMSEYVERHAVSKLIGAPPGYVGYEQSGLLTEAVNKTPHSVILLDEIEKAHPDIYNLLLQVMDHGRLTDNNGREADFRHTIIIMTTNAGAEALSRSSMGFTSQDHTDESPEIVNKAFTPEFRNRLDAIIHFKSLDDQTIHNVVDKFLMELEVQLEDRKVSFTATKGAKNWLAIHGYDKAMGARPMARLIQDRFKKPLAEELLFGKLMHGGLVKVDTENGELIFKISAAAKQTTKH